MLLTDYVRRPEIFELVSNLRRMGVEWSVISERINMKVKKEYFSNSDSLRKTWKRIKNRMENPIVQINIKAYMLDNENYETVTKWHSEQHMTWEEIANVLKNNLNIICTPKHLKDVWKGGKAIVKPFVGDLPKLASISVKNVEKEIEKDEKKHVILEPKMHRRIGVWKNKDCKTWAEIAIHLAKYYNFEISSDHLETTWHEGVRSGKLNSITKFDVRTYMSEYENFYRIMTMRKDGKTWPEISSILSEETKNTVSKSTLNNCWNDLNSQKMSEKSTFNHWLLTSGIYDAIKKWRYEQILGWNNIVEKLKEQYSGEIFQDILINAVKELNLKENEILKNEKNKTDLPPVINYKEILDEETREEVKIWINQAQYTWKDVETRLSKRTGHNLKAQKLRELFYSK